MVELNSESNYHADGGESKPLSGGRVPMTPCAIRKVCFSFAAYARNVIDHLRKCEVPISEGLSEEEFQRLEINHGFCFPPDLKSILQEGLPIGAGFPNWRSASEKQLRLMLSLPIAGFCYEIARGKFWWKQWGSRPSNIDEALEIARRAFTKAPILVPIYCHCYIPCSPNIAGNPVFFVYEKDIFYCGYDLADFFEREVFVPLNFLSASGPACMEQEEDLSLELRRLNSGLGEQNGSKSSIHVIHENIADELKVGGHQEPPEANLETIDEESLPVFNTAEVRWQSKLNDDALAGQKSGDSEPFARKSLCEESRQLSEKPRNAVKSAGNSPTMAQNVMSRYTYFYEQPLPTKAVALFTIAAPPWAAKRARHIDLWGDLAERKENINNSLAEPHFSSYALELDVVKSPVMKHTELSVALGEATVPGRSSKRWLGGYLKQLEKRLRRGGWKQNEIQEMVNAVSPEELCFPKQSGEEILDAISQSMNRLSASLRKAGWSAKDVWEILSFDVKSRHPEHSCRTVTNTGA